MAYSGNTGLRRLWLAFYYAGCGMLAAWRCEEAFRQQVMLSAVLLPLGFWLGESPAERALLAGSAMFPAIVELLNSAVEAAIDRIGQERHELSARAKDMASGAVTLSLLMTAVIWLAVLL